MKRLFCAVVVSVIALAAMPAFAGVSVSIGEPGFFGTIEIGNNTPPPVLVNPQPVIVAPPVAQDAPPPPMYLRVPAAERQHWNRYCGKYNACGRQVYFVQDNWYQNTYAPAYRQQHGMQEPPPAQHAHHQNNHRVNHRSHPQQQPPRAEDGPPPPQSGYAQPRPDQQGPEPRPENRDRY